VWYPATLCPLLLPFLLLASSELTAQSDSAPARCATVGDVRPDSMATVDSEATPDRLPFIDQGPRDADQRAIIAHFVVTAEGGVDTTTVRVEHTNDEAWIEQLRRGLASAKYKPAWRRGCPVARWSTFAVWAQH
jgi:hypothetical protein